MGVPTKLGGWITSVDDKAIVRKYLEEAYNKGNLSWLKRLLPAMSSNTGYTTARQTERV